MGCDIHTFTEKKDANGVYQSMDFHPFEWRSYFMFSILAGVRNRYGATPISEPKELPEDVSDRVGAESSDYGCDGHSHSWLSVQDLVDYDYDQVLEGEKIRDILGYRYFENISLLQKIEADRIVFWFDN